jgi:hypothetical protein
MRITILAALLVSAAGCSTNQMYFEPRSDLESRTSSIVLYEGSELGHGSMNEQTCQFDTRNGLIIEDWDLPTSTETVEDVRGQIVLAKSAQGLHVFDENGWDQANDIALSGVLHSRMTLDGVASLLSDEQGCRLDWRNDDLVTTTELDDAVCASASGFAVDPATEQAWVAYGEDVASVTADGVTNLGLEADLASLDEPSGTVFFAQRGGTTVSAITAEGAVMWSVDTNAEIFDMDDMGAIGAAAVVVATRNGADVRAFSIDGGEEIADYSMPETAEVVVSGDSTTIAFVEPDVVHFYDVFQGKAPIVFNDVPAEPPPMFTD